MAKKRKKKTIGSSPKRGKTKVIAADSLFEHLTLKHIRLLSAECRLDIVDGSVPATAETRTEASLKLSPEGTSILVNTKVSLASDPAGKKDSAKDSSAVSLSVTYQCVYSIVKADVEGLLKHAEMICGNGIFVSWPYIREMVRSLTGRMEIAPFSLPLIKIGAGATPVPVVPLEEKKAVKKLTGKKAVKKLTGKKAVKKLTGK